MKTKQNKIPQKGEKKKKPREVIIDNSDWYRMLEAPGRIFFVCMEKVELIDHLMCLVPLKMTSSSIR